MDRLRSKPSTSSSRAGTRSTTPGRATRRAAAPADEKAERGARRAALATLLTLPGRRAAALEQAAMLLDPGAALEEGLKLVEIFGGCDDPAAARVLAKAYPALSGKLQDA